MLSSPWASAQCITLNFFHLLQWEQVMDTYKLFTQPGSRLNTATSALLQDFWFLANRNLCGDLNTTSQRRADRCSEFLDVQPSEPRGHTPAPHTLFGFSRSEFLAPASQPKQEMHEMLCCLRKRVNIVSLLLIIGRFLEKPHQRYACYLQCPSADLLLPCQQASAQAWPNWASCHTSSPGLACGRWGCWGVDRHRICSTVTCEVSFPAKRCPTDWQSACIARGACTTCTAQPVLSLLLLLLHSNKQGLMWQPVKFSLIFFLS